MKLTVTEGGVSMYDALTVARYIIDRSFRKKDPVSNLRLQKLLYFVQLESYRENNNPMFSDDIVAWQFGPVVPDVYYEYNVYAGTPILLEYKDLSVIEDSDKRIIDRVIDTMKDIPIWKLVDLTHKSAPLFLQKSHRSAAVRHLLPCQSLLEQWHFLFH